MRRTTSLLVVLFCVAGMPARAQQVTEIYKCLDPSGRPLFTSDRRDTVGKKCELVARQVMNEAAPAGPAAARPAPRERSASPAGFPKEDAGSRASAKDRQREILERELAQEESMLAKAKKEFADQENLRSGDEKNYARVLERLQPYKNTLEVHTKNVDALRQELGKLR